MRAPADKGRGRKKGGVKKPSKTKKAKEGKKPAKVLKIKPFLGLKDLRSDFNACKAATNKRIKALETILNRTGLALAQKKKA
eukprot:gene9183-49115_t